MLSKYHNLSQLFYVFIKVGTFTFGGGYAMLPLIQKEVVDHLHWVTEHEIVDIFAISQSVPGVISLNSAIFIGKKVAGIPGAIVAAAGVVLPAFLSILLILLLLMRYQNNIYIEKAFGGIRAASAALILLSAIKLGRSILKDKVGWFIAALSFTAIILLNINAAWAIVASGLMGYVIYRWHRRKNRAA